MNNERKQNKKNFRKVLKMIKWENIFTIVSIPFFLYCIYTHIKLNGFYDMLGYEFGMYSMIVFGFRYIIKDMRTNTKEWFDIFFQ